MATYDRQREALETAHRAVVDGIRNKRETVERLLAIENEQAGEAPAFDRLRLVPLMDFLLAKVATHGPVDKDHLRAEADAAGFFDEGNGRTFHTTLMNITRGGKVTQLPDGRYEAPPTLSNFLKDEKEGKMQTLM